MAATLIFWVVLGGLVGAFAKSVLWYERAQGWAICIVFGAAGGVVGGYLRKMAGTTDGFDLSSMGLVVLGAAAVLGASSLFAKRTPIAGQDRRAA
jgi:uncharacterized membrane protein YeaQ/YmgE (transglycosylase-associated protein family)